MSEVVTELVIDADTSGAATFSRAMGDAQAAAERTMGTLGDLNGSLGDTISGFSGLGTTLVGGGVVAGFLGVLEYIKTANKELADMQTQAKQVGLTLSDLQGISFGGQVSGLSTDQINAGLAKSASLLNDASRNANSLSKELDANGISVKTANGQLISENQLLAIAADLVAKAKNPGDQLAIAQMLGFTKEWIPLLEQGSGAMAGLTKAAQDAGAVIDDETISKAADFDTQWRKSSVEFSTNMKAALASLLPFFDDMVDRAAKFVKSISVADIEKAANQQLDALAKPAGIPDAGGLTITITDDAKKSIEEIKNAATLWDQVAAALKFATDGKSAFNTQAVSAADVKWTAGTDAVSNTPDQINAAKNTAAWAAEGDAYKKLSAEVAAGSSTMVTGFSKVAARAEETRDILQRAIDTLDKHTSQTAADTDAVGLGAGAQASFRAEAALTAAAIANHTPITAALAAKFKDLADDAGDAALDLAKVKEASNISFASQTSLFSAEDLKIATQLRSLYGDDIPAAMASSEAAQIRLNDQIKAAGDLAKSAGSTFANDFVSGILSGKSAMDSLSAAASSLGKTLTSSGINNIFKDPTSAVGYIETGIGIVTQLVTGNTAAKKALSEAQSSWASMATSVTNFNQSAKGFSLGTLTSELQSLYSTAKSLEEAALKAHDTSGYSSTLASWNASVVSIVSQFQSGTATYDALTTSINSVKNEASGLEATLNQLGLTSWANVVDQSIQGRIDSLVSSASDALVSSLTSRLNTANGQSYLNDINTLIAQHKSDLTTAAETGSDPTVMAQIATVFEAEAQKIVDNAGLVGDSFDSFIKQFPSLAGVVHASTTSIAASQASLQSSLDAAGKSIVDYVNGLYAGSNSLLSPQDRLSAAQSAYNAKLALAEGGNTDAQSSITGDAQSLLDAAKAVYASSAGFQDIFKSVTTQLLSLSSVTGTTDPVVAAVRDVLTAVNTSNASLVPIQSNTAVANSLSTTANSLAQTQNSLSASMVTLTSAINGLSDRMVSALNALGTNAASIGNSQYSVLTQMNQRLAQIATNTGKSADNSGSGSIWSWLGFADGGQIPGGIVGNGVYGVDSVRARYAGGGDIMLAGGEFVTRAPSVTPATLPTLNYINDNGRVPGGASNDNGAYFAALARTNSAGFNAICAELQELRQAVYGGAKMQADAINRRPTPRPGVKSAA